MRKTNLHQSDNFNKIKGKYCAFITHEQEALAETLNSLNSEIEIGSEDIIIEKLKRCFKSVDNIIAQTNWFLNECLSLTDTSSHSLHYPEMHEEAKRIIRQALALVSKLRKKSLFSLIPLAKDLVIDLDDIKILVSKTTIGQANDTMEGYSIRRSHFQRKIENI